MHRVQQEHNNYMHSENFTCIVHVCSQEFRTLPITSNIGIFPVSIALILLALFITLSCLL